MMAISRTNIDIAVLTPATRLMSSSPWGDLPSVRTPGGDACCFDEISLERTKLDKAAREFSIAD